MPSAPARSAPRLQRGFLAIILAVSITLLLVQFELSLSRRGKQLGRASRAEYAAVSYSLTLPTTGVSPYYWQPVHKGFNRTSPLVLIFDAHYVCASSALYLVGRGEPTYGITAQTFEGIRGELLSADGDVITAQPRFSFAWEARVDHESVALGVWRGDLPGIGSDSCGGLHGRSEEPHILLRLHFGPFGTDHRWQATQPLHMLRPPTPKGTWLKAAARTPRIREGTLLLPAPALTDYAICTTVMTASDLIRLWLRYYALKGVGSFYLYAVAPSGPQLTALVRALEATVEGVLGGAAITIIPWPFNMYSQHQWDVYVDGNYAQPAALNSCTSRYAMAHKGLLFYDVDEFLCTRHYSTVGAWLDALKRRFPDRPPHTFVTSMAWALLGAHPRDFNFTLPAYRALRRDPRPLPLLRSPDNCTLGGDLFLCPLNCSNWAHRGGGPSRRVVGTGYVPIPPPPHDDDDRSSWSINDTEAEWACWYNWSGLSAPSALPSPEPNDDYRFPFYTPPARPVPSPLGLNPTKISLRALITSSLTRTSVKVGGGREKYILPNTSVLFDGGEKHAVVNIHGMYSNKQQQLVLQPEDGYHLHFLNDNRTEALAQRVAAFFYQFVDERCEHTFSSGLPFLLTP